MCIIIRKCKQRVKNFVVMESAFVFIQFGMYRHCHRAKLWRKYRGGGGGGDGEMETLRQLIRQDNRTVHLLTTTS